MNLIFANDTPDMKLIEKNQVPFLQFPILTETGIVQHGFSTRAGGVSKGIFQTMNLSFARGDKKEDVMENFRRMSAAIGVHTEDLVFSKQTHETNIRIVTEEDRGKGIVKSLDYDHTDGLITNIAGLCLATFYADCVPLYFVDPVHKAIGLSHSGWRGTVGKMGQKTLEKMNHEYGTKPEQVIAAIGPSICQECYEVSADVVAYFKKEFHPQYWCDLFYEKEDGKYQLNLWKANEIILREAGVPKEQIGMANLCTCCNEKYLFSHRASQGKRGNLGGFLALKS
ncbi:MAG: peptidoglycan editing factor PgeF [Lachnospiraceae bacterium]